MITYTFLRRRFRFGATILLILISLVLVASPVLAGTQQIVDSTLTNASGQYTLSVLPGTLAGEMRPAERLLQRVDATPLPEGISTSWWSTVQNSIRRGEYNLSWQDNVQLPEVSAAYQAPNRAQNLRTYFTPSGIRIVPRTDVSSKWKLGLALTGYGYVGDIQPAGAAELTPVANKIEYRREALTEWYVNGASGLEQGFTVFAPPAHTASLDGKNTSKHLVLELGLSGDLTPAPTDGGRAIELITPGGGGVCATATCVQPMPAGRNSPPVYLYLRPLSLS